MGCTVFMQMSFPYYTCILLINTFFTSVKTIHFCTSLKTTFLTFQHFKQVQPAHRLEHEVELTSPSDSVTYVIRTDKFDRFTSCLLLCRNYTNKLSGISVCFSKSVLNPKL